MVFRTQTHTCACVCCNFAIIVLTFQKHACFSLWKADICFSEYSLKLEFSNQSMLN